jgi:phosphoribosylanthranilate isomerase
MVIKAFGVNESIDFLMLKPYLNAVDYFLFDTQSPSYGGTGRAFDWDILRKYPYDKPYFLSGGLGLENLKQLKELSDDRLFALDLNSKFETESGIKNVKGVAEAIKIIRSIEREEQS